MCLNEYRAIWRVRRTLACQNLAANPSGKILPGCSAVENKEHVLVHGPPYRAPHIAKVAVHSIEHLSDSPNLPLDV